MTGSILSVHVINGRNLKPAFTDPASANVSLSVEGKRQDTQTAALTNNPEWDKVIAFDIEQGKDNLLVEVFDNNHRGVQKPIGFVKIDLKELSQGQKEWAQRNPGKSNIPDNLIDSFCLLVSL